MSFESDDDDDLLYYNTLIIRNNAFCNKVTIDLTNFLTN